MATPPKKPASKTPRQPARPKNLPHGRWLGDFPRLSAAERRLVECCRTGDIWFPNGWSWQKSVRPDQASAGNRIRADLIRFLALGGDDLHPVHEAGVMLLGAWIPGTLNLQLCKSPVSIILSYCYLEQSPNFSNAELPSLSLSGTAVPGLIADGIKVNGDLILRDGFTATGEVRLLGANIGGDLTCVGSTISNAGKSAISADRMKVTGGIFLRNGFAAVGEVRLLGVEIGGGLSCDGGSFSNAGSKAIRADGIKLSGDISLGQGFTATGEVRLTGAEIGGDLACVGGRFSNALGTALSADRMKVAGGVFLRDGFISIGEVRLLGAEIGGALECSGGSFSNAAGNALSADGLKVIGTTFLRNASIDGAVLLSAARIGSLVDDISFWAAGHHILDGFHYDRIIGPLDAASCIGWLKSQRSDQNSVEDWSPQPWEQLIKVMREMGHPGTAAEIAMEKQRMMRSAGQIGTRLPRTNFKWAWRNWVDAQWAKLSNALARGFHDLYGVLAGYGHRPTRIAAWMVTVWLLCSGLYWTAADGFAAFGPANPVVTSAALYPDADDLCGHGNEPGKTRWTECPGVPDEYSTFQPFIYSLDVILPLIDLQQEADWAPIAEGPTGTDLPMGVFIRWVMWFEILFGWLASLMFVAIVSRLVDKD